MLSGERSLPFGLLVSDAQEQLTPKSAVEFCTNSNSSQLLYKNEEDPIINEGASFPIISLWEIFSDAQGQLTPQSLIESG